MIKNIIFDFDGVILDAVPVKTQAFRILFKDFPAEAVATFIVYHLQHGGVSRYEKIRYFFEKILHQYIDGKLIQLYADKYSLLTKNTLTDPKYLIEDTLSFIRSHHKNYNMHIASGADEKDLREICQKLDLEKFFVSIHGSPQPKHTLVVLILNKYQYLKIDTVLIGDSMTDYQAAQQSAIEFYGYNSEELQAMYPRRYLNKLEEIQRVCS